MGGRCHTVGHLLVSQAVHAMLLTMRFDVFPHQLAFLIDNPIRRAIIGPKAVADRMPLTADSQVLEIGCGPGTYSIEVARRIPEGHLELFDLQEEMLNKTRRKIEKAGLEKDAGYTQGDARDLPFGDAAFDIVFLVTVLGEVPDRKQCLASIRRVLRPGGCLSITEHLPDPDFHLVSRLRALVEEKGFRFDQRFGRPWCYTANFIAA